MASERTQKKRNRRTLAGQLAGAGFAFPFDISDILDRALRAGVSDPFSYAYALILKSKRFRTHYPGIFRRNGTLKMKPAEYEAYVDAARSAAASAGFKLSRRQIGQAIGTDKSLDELSFQISKAAEIRANADVLTVLNQRLRASKLKPLRTAQEALDFFNGRAPKSVYDIYESATTLAAAKRAGINISVARARNLAARTTDVLSFEEAEKRYRTIAEQLRQAGPELRLYGIRQGDLETIEFGGPGRAEAASRAEQALRQRQATLESDIASQGVQIDPATGRPISGFSQQPGF